MAIVDFSRPYAIKAAKANVTNGEMYQVFWDVYGEWPHLD